jgi:tRNA (cmo5U34)-methyltransferase
MAGCGAEEIGEHDWHDARYVDAWISQRIEGDAAHRAQLDRIARVVATLVTADQPLVLDVGTGPGVLAAAILRTLPTAHVVAQDFSRPMLDRAASELSWAADRITFHESDLAARDWHAGLDEPFDVIVASYAIHNLRAPERIRAVYHDVAGLQRPGGCFVLLDLVESPGPRMDAVYGRRRRRDDAAVASLAEQLGWFADAGLIEVDCLWKDDFEAAICGFRP